MAPFAPVPVTKEASTEPSAANRTAVARPMSPLPPNTSATRRPPDSVSLTEIRP